MVVADKVRKSESCSYARVEWRVLLWIYEMIVILKRVETTTKAVSTKELIAIWERTLQSCENTGGAWHTPCWSLQVKKQHEETHSMANNSELSIAQIKMPRAFNTYSKVPHISDCASALFRPFSSLHGLLACSDGIRRKRPETARNIRWPRRL